MHEQLLLPTDRPWRLDDRTREVGRRGVQQARAALRRSADGGVAGPATRSPIRRSEGRRTGDRRLTRPTAA